MTALDKAIAISGYSKDQLRGPDRCRAICRVRWAAMATMRRRGMSTPAIGRILHRDHSTVLHGLKQAETLKADTAFRQLVEALA